MAKKKKSLPSTAKKTRPLKNQKRSAGSSRSARGAKNVATKTKNALSSSGTSSRTKPASPAITGALPVIDRDKVVNLWFQCQGLANVACHSDSRSTLNKTRFRDLLLNVGGLQVDAVNVVDRAHYLTLWSRFGSFPRQRVDNWIYQDKIAYEYWAHEASILPAEHMPLSRRRMKNFPPDAWSNASYWKRYETSEESKKRVLARLRKSGPLESGDFEKTEMDRKQQEILGWGAPLVKEDKRSLQLLWHAGRIGIHDRRHFRKIYDLGTRVYSKSPTATQNEFDSSWLLQALRGCGVTPESHMVNYLTAQNLKAADRRKLIEKHVKQKKIVPVRIQGSDETAYALPEHLDKLSKCPSPVGTTLVCPFDSFLWQRQRAEELLGFRYRIEIYVPEKKREFGYYVLPILHDGKLVGRVDPKLHRSSKNGEANRLEIKKVFLEPGFKRTKRFEIAFRQVIQSLAKFLDAESIKAPRDWSILT